MVNGTERAPIGNDLYGAFGRDFATRDGRRVMIAAITARQWKSLVDASPARSKTRDVISALYAEISTLSSLQDNSC